MRPDDWQDAIGWAMCVAGLVLMGMATVGYLTGCCH